MIDLALMTGIAPSELMDSDVETLNYLLQVVKDQQKRRR